MPNSFVPDPNAGQASQGGSMPSSFTPDSSLSFGQSKAVLGHSNSLFQGAVGLGGQYADMMKQFSTGVAQSELQTVQSTGQLVQTGLDQTVGRGLNEVLGKGNQPTSENNINNPESTSAQQMSALDTPQGAGQNTGFWTGELAQFLAPTDAVKGAEGAIDASKLGTASKVLAKAGTEAAAGGGVSLAETGDPKQAAETAATFGALKGTTGAIGAGLKAIGLPEHLYSTVFKTASSDMLKELKSGGIDALQKSNPTLFKQFVDSGIVKTGAGGKFTVDETVAKQALDKGLKGSVKNMANAVVKGSLQNESDAQAIAAKTTTPVTIPGSDKLVKVLQTVQDDYANVGQGETSTKAANYIDALQKGNGQVDAKTGLGLRRFLDGMRSQASYNPQAKLATTATNFKYWSDAVRGEINKIPGMTPVMKDYKFNIDALTSLAKTAASRGNQQLVSMLDAIIFDGGIQEGSPGLGAAMGITRKVLTTPGGATRLGSAVQNSGTMSKLGSLVKGGISKLIGGVGSQGQSTPEDQT